MSRQLQALIAPRAIAIVGASGDAARLTARPQQFLQAHGFAGAVYPVNPTRQTIFGSAAFATVAEINKPVDHAYIVARRDRVREALADCAIAGVPVVSVLADGFSEAGPEGVGLERQLVADAAAAGILLLGPNSMGVVDTRSKTVLTTNAAFRAAELPTGRTAALSQSGSMIGALFSRAAATGTGFATLVSLGNEAATGVGEIGSLLLGDPDIDSFVLFLETLRRPDAVASFARAAHQAGKPIVAYVVGTSDEGRALAVSHTGALTGAADAMSAFLRAHGIFEVRTIDALLTAPAALKSLLPRVRHRPRSAAVVTTTGGGGAIFVDRIGETGTALVGPSPQTKGVLKAAGLTGGATKLVDVTLAGANSETMQGVLTSMAADTTAGVVVSVIGSSAQFEPERAVDPMIAVAAKEMPHDAAPLVGCVVPHAPEAIANLQSVGISAFQSLETCATVVDLALSSRPLASQSTAPALPEAVVDAIGSAPKGMLNEAASGDILRALGLALPQSVFLARAVSAPDKLPMPGPFVLKLVSRDLAHKTEAGAIILGLPDAASVAAAMEQMTDRITAERPDVQLDGYLVQRQMRGIGELLVGVTRDPRVGPVITIGSGGVLAEVVRDTVCRIAPLSRDDAFEAILELKCAALLRGFRDGPQADLDALAQAISQISTLASLPRVEEVEVNPILARNDGAICLDAIIRLR